MKVQLPDRSCASEAAIRALVIIPALNEAATLPTVLADLRTQVPECDIVVVDDGSTDGTATAARAGGAVVLTLPFNLGIGGALRTGFRYAVDHDYDQAIQFDADGQHDAGSVRAMLAALDHADFAIGSRFGGSASYEIGRTRRRAMRLLQFTLRVLSGRTFSDTSSGFRAFNRPILEYFARTYPSEYMESVEALLAASYEGFTIVEVPIQMHERAGGEASNRQWKLGYHYIRVILTMVTKASRHRRPTSAAASPAQHEPEPSQ